MSRRDVSGPVGCGARSDEGPRREERRTEERTESYELISVLSKDGLGGRVVLPILLHNRSPRGIGGVCVGKAPLAPSASHWTEGPEGELQKLRLVWVGSVASHVYVLGFVIL